MVSRRCFKRLLFVAVVALLDSLVAATGMAVPPEGPSGGNLHELESRMIGVMERLRPTVVHVGGGSGVIIRADGLVLTCYHVIDHLPEEVIPVTVAGGRTVNARKLGFDSGNDMALLQISDEQQEWPYAKLGYSSLTKSGTWCLSLGYPFHAVSTKPPVLRLGRVLGVSPWWLAADSLTEGGDCGGPLFNVDGEVIAINTGGNFSWRGTTHIAIDVYRKAASRLQRGERYRDPWRDDYELASLYGILPASGGDLTEIAAVLPGSSAEKAGLRPGDIVSKCDGRTIARLGDLLSDDAGAARLRSEISIIYIRNGQEQTSRLSCTDPQRIPAFQLLSQWIHGNEWLNEHPEVELYQRNSPAVRRQVAQDVTTARHAVVVLYIDGKRSRLGAVVAENGTIVTTAGGFSSNTECHLSDGRVLPAKLLGQDPRSNVAVLQVAARDLVPLSWNENPLAVGTLLVAVHQHEDPLAYGVVGTEPRPLHASLGDLITWNHRRVTRASPHSEIGLQLGDVIERVNGTSVGSDREFADQLRQHVPGEPLLLEVTREHANPSAGPQQIKLEGFGYPAVHLHDAVIGSYHLGGPMIGLDGKAVGINVGRCRDISTCLLPSQTVQRIVETIVSDSDSD